MGVIHLLLGNGGWCCTSWSGCQGLTRPRLRRGFRLRRRRCGCRRARGDLEQARGWVALRPCLTHILCLTLTVNKAEGGLLTNGGFRCDACGGGCRVAAAGGAGDCAAHRRGAAADWRGFGGSREEADGGLGVKPGDGLCRVHRDRDRIIADRAHGVHSGRDFGGARGADKGGGTGDAAGVFRLFHRPAARGLQRQGLRAALGLAAAMLLVVLVLAPVLAPLLRRRGQGRLAFRKATVAATSLSSISGP